jgi:uncharacterized membrane protein SpoIIM required for sporulation
VTTVRQFEAMHAPTWAALERVLEQAEEGAKRYDGAALASLYRRSCEHLALAQARAYPIHLVQRLESLTERAHRQVYRPQGFELAQLREFALVGFPQAVRAHRAYLLAAAALFLLPMLVLGWASWRDPGFILHLLDARQVQQFDAMYGPGAGGIGRERSADTDWEMFGYYIMNNIGIGFQCFAAGVFAGVGSAFYLVFNGLFIGAIGGYVIARGHGENFLSFVATHGAFELTAIVLAGAAGLRLGHALLAPGRLTRVEALRHGAREAVVVVYGAAALLVIAAAVEAFWSSARWIAPTVKYAVAAACWLLVIGYLAWQGRPAEDARAG